MHYEVTKKSQLGAPQELNDAAMIISSFMRYVERTPTMKGLVKRLHDDIAFKLNGGFLVSDSIPSEVSYSQLVNKFEECNILETERVKGHLAVGTSSQYILQSFFSLGSLNDRKAALPLLMGINVRLLFPFCAIKRWTLVIITSQYTNRYIKLDNNL